MVQPGVVEVLSHVRGVCSWCQGVRLTIRRYMLPWCIWIVYGYVCVQSIQICVCGGEMHVLTIMLTDATPLYI